MAICGAFLELRCTRSNPPTSLMHFLTRSEKPNFILRYRSIAVARLSKQAAVMGTDFWPVGQRADHAIKADRSAHREDACLFACCFERQLPRGHGPDIGSEITTGIKPEI